MEEDDAATAVRFDGAAGADWATACPALARMLTATSAHNRDTSPLIIERVPLFHPSRHPRCTPMRGRLLTMPRPARFFPSQPLTIYHEGGFAHCLGRAG